MRVPETPRPRQAPTPPARRRFERRRARALAAGGALLACLAGIGWLVEAPHALGAVRLGEVGVAWWAAVGALVVLGAVGWLGLDPAPGSQGPPPKDPGPLPPLPPVGGKGGPRGGCGGCSTEPGAPTAAPPPEGPPRPR